MGTGVRTGLLLIGLVTCRLAIAGQQQDSANQGVAQQPYCDAIGEKVEHGASLTQACEFVQSLRHRLPNFICDQKMERYEDVFGRPYLRDTITAQVTHDESGERYADVKLNNKPTNAQMQKFAGSWSIGEFGGDLRVFFEPQSRAEFKFLRSADLEHTSTYIFEFKVAAADNHSWALNAQNVVTYPGFTGKIWIRSQDGRVMRLEARASELQPTSKISGFHKNISYSEIALGDGSNFVLPSNSEAVLCPWREHCWETFISFHNCHKFAAKARIVPDGAHEQ